MSVEQTDVVDFIATDRVTGDVVLTVADHLEWGAECFAEHVAALGLKLGRYVDFIKSGQIVQEYPKAKERKIRIEVALKYPAFGASHKWLEEARAQCLLHGYALSWYVLDAT